VHTPLEAREPQHAPLQAQEPQPAPLEAREPQPAATPAPARHEPPAPREPDPAEIERALRESGLEMVQTRAAGPIELPPDAEFVPAKRERRPPPPDINEPLVQVETTRDPSEQKP
jgi:ribonuclease E